MFPREIVAEIFSYQEELKYCGNINTVIDLNKLKKVVNQKPCLKLFDKTMIVFMKLPITNIKSYIIEREYYMRNLFTCVVITYRDYLHEEKEKEEENKGKRKKKRSNRANEGWLLG
jgi:hypothetical protein